VEVKLPNGLTVLILENHRLPLVSVQFHILGAGPLYEPPEMPGLADATASMLSEGAKGRTSLQIAEQVDRLGATFSASSSFGSPAVVISASGLSDNFDQWFGLVSDILLNPAFPAEELERLKQRLKIGLREQRTSPSFLAAERFNHAIYGTHPAATVSATSESIDALTPELLAKWHREQYAPQSAILGIAGDVSADTLVPKLTKWLGAWKGAGSEAAVPSSPAPASARGISLIDRPNSVQTTITLGNLAISRTDPDYIPMTVMNRILGGGSSARLFLKLREEKGYTYSVRSSFTALNYPGAWVASSDVRTDVTDGALAEFMNEIRRIRDEQVPQHELEEAERSIVAHFALSLEQASEMLDSAISRKVYNLPADYWDTYPARIMAVTAADVQHVARKHINLDALQIVAVGDATRIKPALEKYGHVELYDTDGKARVE
jgi:zinc protease